MNLHIVLYAKGWYDKSENEIEDLKKLQGRYFDIDPEYVNEETLLVVVSQIFEEIVLCQLGFNFVNFMRSVLDSCYNIRTVYGIGAFPECKEDLHPLWLCRKRRRTH